MAVSPAITSQFLDDSAPQELTGFITLRQAAAELPSRRAGKKTSIQSLYRWTGRGLRGEKLKYMMIGATRCTTREWMREFFERLTRATAADGPAGAESAPSLRSPGERRRGNARARRALEKMGV
jgi:hypothetical protein